MKIKIILILLFALGVLGSLHAQQATQIEVTNAAINTLMYESDLGLYYSTDSVDNIYTKSLNGNVVLYEVHFTNGSSVLLSGSKSFIPVLAVLSSETDDPTASLLNNYANLPDVLKDIIDTYAEAIDSIFNSATTNDYLYEWNILQQYNPNTYKSGTNSVGPLLTTKWGQDESNNGSANAYNYYVTKTSYSCGGETAAKCPAGCVAVAMAQIMRYWSYPQVFPYKCSQYVWSDMPDKLKTTDSYYDFYRKAVSRLIQDCAASVNMRYCAFGRCGSEARDDSVAIALKLYYGYSNVEHKLKNNYSSSVWESMLRQDLDNGFPIYYRGDSKKGRGGHAFVCDGYKKIACNSEYKYHFNFGELGNGNGWFIINNGGNLYRFEFFYNQAATFNCYPTNCWKNIIMECDKTYSAGFSETYSADSVFSNAGHNYIINSGANINLTAGHEIYLSNGFYVAEGSSFTATIAPCGDAKSMDEGGDLISQPQDSIPTTKSLQKQVVTPSGVSVYPNPVTGTLHIALLNPKESVKQVLVTNLLGNVVLQQDNLPDGTINTTPLATGMYIARICTVDGKTYHAKFVKK